MFDNDDSLITWKNQIPIRCVFCSLSGRNLQLVQLNRILSDNTSLPITNRDQRGLLDVTQGSQLEYRNTFCAHRVKIKLSFVRRKTDINGLVQERCNSSALAPKLHLSCINPSIFPTVIIFKLYGIPQCWPLTLMVTYVHRSWGQVTYALPYVHRPRCDKIWQLLPYSSYKLCGMKCQ